MDNLLKIITSVDFGDYGSLQLVEVELSDGNLSFVLDVTADEEPELPRNIRVTCHASRESNISPNHYYDLSVAEDHVVLWHYTSPHTLMSFYGKVEDPISVVGALYERHFALVEGWIPFHKYLNSGLPLSELIRGSFGMLAEGPDQLVLAYEEVMQRFGFSTSHHESGAAMQWDGEKWVQDRSPLSVMFFDESYVIAEGFTASAIQT
jgi:hypothetical protein